MVLETGKSRSIVMTLGNMIKPSCGETEQTYCPGPPFSPQTTAVVPGAPLLMTSDILIISQRPHPQITQTRYINLNFMRLLFYIVWSPGYSLNRPQRQGTEKELQGVWIQFQTLKGAVFLVWNLRKSCVMFLSSQGYCEGPIRLWM